MNCINVNQLNLISKMRNLWEQHVFWTRLLIISILSNLNDLDATQTRLLRNPVDMGALFGKFYGPTVQKTVADLFTEHLVIGAQLITAFKNNDTASINKLNPLWYKNADEIAKAFSNFNPYYKEQEIKDMLYMHLDLTKNEVSLRLKGNYVEDVNNFDIIEKQALEMADYFSSGIVMQFPNMFMCY